MPAYIRIFKNTQPSHTSGADVKSPARLISGTAVPALAPEMNTAALFSGLTISVGHIFDSSHEPETKTRVPVVKRKRSKRSRKMSQERRSYDMLPVYRDPEALLPQGLNTSLAVKANEEMSEFERKYPW